VIIRAVWLLELCDYFVSVAKQPHSSLGRLIFELSRPNTIIYTHSTGLLWTSDEPVAEAATYTNTPQTQGTKNPCPQRDSNAHSSNRAVETNDFSPHGHWDRWGV